MSSCSTVRSLLEGHSSFTIVVHSHADMDALGSATGLANAFDSATTIVAPDGVQERAQRLVDQFGTRLHEPSSADVTEADCIVVVDAPSSERIAPLPIHDAAGDVIVVDHHEPGDLADLATASYIDTAVGATATLVDGAGDRLTELPDLLECDQSFSKRVAATKAVVRSRGYRADRTLVLTTTVGGEQTAAAHALRATGADVALVFSDRGSQTWVVGRSDSDVVHLPEDLFMPLVDEYGGDGGGHAEAGTAKLDSSALEDIRASTLDQLEAALSTNLSQMSE